MRERTVLKSLLASTKITHTLVETWQHVSTPAFSGGLPRRLCFENFVCRNEKIWTLGGRTPGTPPRSANGIATDIYCTQ